MTCPQLDLFTGYCLMGLALLGAGCVAYLMICAAAWAERKLLRRRDRSKWQARCEAAESLLWRVSTAAIVSPDKQGMWTADDKVTGKLVHAITKGLSDELIEWKRHHIRNS